MAVLQKHHGAMLYNIDMFYVDMLYDQLRFGKELRRRMADPQLTQLPAKEMIAAELKEVTLSLDIIHKRLDEIENYL